jgi:bleomycin hydrolase
MRSVGLVAFGILCSFSILAQTPNREGLTLLKSNSYTPVKNQANTGTCWSFSTTSLIESQSIKNGIGELDLSEMFTVRNIYIDKARNYLLRQGAAQFGPGGLGHDVIASTSKYGAVPESMYSGLSLGNTFHDHSILDKQLKSYLDTLLITRPLRVDWLDGFQRILDNHLGKVPETFTYREKVYTPQSFAKEVLKFNAEDYVFLTSFTHHPFYSTFVLEIPDNYANQAYYNIPLEEMIKATEEAVLKGYSVMWDADVSNSNFKQREGFALFRLPGSTGTLGADGEEAPFDQTIRQQLFETLETQDDHLMHIVGLEKSKGGKNFFLVKNSWGEVGPFKGLINVSEAYFAINTITLVIPKAALDPALKAKLHLRQ